MKRIFNKHWWQFKLFYSPCHICFQNTKYRFIPTMHHELRGTSMVFCKKCATGIQNIDNSRVIKNYIEAKRRLKEEIRGQK